MSQGGHHKEAPLYNMTQANGWGTGLSTCKESGLFLKSMSSQNISSFGHHFRRLATLSYNHTHVTQINLFQPAALFTSDQISLFQLSKDWGREERWDREDNHTLTHTSWGIQLPHTSTHTHTSGVRGAHRCERPANQGRTNRRWGGTHTTSHTNREETAVLNS